MSPCERCARLDRFVEEIQAIADCLDNNLSDDGTAALSDLRDALERVRRDLVQNGIPSSRSTSTSP